MARPQLHLNLADHLASFWPSASSTLTLILLALAASTGDISRTSASMTPMGAGNDSRYTRVMPAELTNKSPLSHLGEITQRGNTDIHGVRSALVPECVH